MSKKTENLGGNVKQSSPIRNQLVGFVAGLLFIFIVGSAYAAGQKGTLGNLFVFLSGNQLENGRPVKDVYRLDGRNIKDGTVTNYELSHNAVEGKNIKNGTITENKLDPNISFGSDLWKKSATSGNIFYSSGSVGVGTQNPTRKLEVAGNIKTTLPTQNTDAATKEYVDNVVFAQGGVGGVCYYANFNAFNSQLDRGCGPGFTQMPGSYNTGPDIYSRHIICCK